MSEKHRIIGRWYIGDTLGKGGYSWVKKGKDIKTGKTVALKFMEKADSSWIKEQAGQVETEIGALKNIRHKNVMKLYAYNLNAQYPLKERGKYVETILLVLEYAPGGELFDILYYTSKLEMTLARTYFRQFIEGLQACHTANVVHRDLKPQNLLLDAKYNLKITDFGLSKVIQSDKDAVMKTSYVGTRGYQAPELLRKEKYDLKCDVFSAGVILFILLAGYPPFEQAAKDDKWFKPLHEKKFDKFWKAHHKSVCAQDKDLRDLLQKMLASDPKERLGLKEVQEHAWYTGKVLPPNELIVQVKRKHRKANEARRADVRKMKDLKQSINPNRAIVGVEKLQPPAWPTNKPEWVWAYGNKDKTWMEVYNFVEESVAAQSGGYEVDFDEGFVIFSMSVAQTQQIKTTQEERKENPDKKYKNIEVTYPIKFMMKVYRSTEWGLNRVPQDQKDRLKEKQEDHVYAIDFRLVEGDRSIWNSHVLNEFLLKQCSYRVQGLPKWALKIQDTEKEAPSNQDDEKEDGDGDDDEYFNILSEKVLGDLKWDIRYEEQGKEVST